MSKILNLQLSPQSSLNEQSIKEEVRKNLQINDGSTLNIKILKRSIDARGRKIKINLNVLVGIDEILTSDEIFIKYQHVSESTKTCHIIGAGPAGLFAALRCLELGIKPILIDRGKDVKARRRDLANINKNHLVNPESNYCFGEGGAGTYSDGKLYTRSNKRGNIKKILQTLVYHGANPEILIDAHPHIGTNKLPQLIENIRERILFFGGEVRFNTKLIDFEIKENSVSAITLMKETSEFNEPIQNMILATGHSARDIYELLNSKKLYLEPKPFAIGIRVEHPQSLIDGIQYHNYSRIFTCSKL